MRMKTTITFELETNIREQLAAICSRYNLSLEEAFTSFAESGVAYLQGLCHQLSYQISANRRKNISPTIGKPLHNP